jgi:hypothetical protein
MLSPAIEALSMDALPAAVSTPNQLFPAILLAPLQTMAANATIALDRSPSYLDSITGPAARTFIPITATNRTCEAPAVDVTLRAPILQASLVHRSATSRSAPHYFGAFRLGEKVPFLADGAFVVEGQAAGMGARTTCCRC